MATEGGRAARCDDEALGFIPGTLGADGSYRAPSGVRYLPYDRLMIGPDGRACIGTGWYRAGTPAPDGGLSQFDENNSPGNTWSGQYPVYPPCPVQPGQSTAGTSAALWAARYWETVPLPRPNPRIQPDWGITGKWVFLQTQGQTTFTHNTPTTPFGPLTIQAKGLYYVNWGDGENSGPYSIEGKHWPDGVIKHIYINVGSYDITVTERWTATWQFGPKSGVLRELRTTGQVLDYPLRQIQAVVVVPGR